MVTGPIGQSRASYGGVAVTGEQYMYVRNAILGGMSANAVIREIAGTDLRMRDAAVFAIRREVLGAERRSAVIQSTPYNFYPSMAAFEPTARGIGGNFRVYADAYVPSPHDPTELTRFGVTITYDRPLTRLQLVEAAISILGNAMEKYEFDLSAEDIIFNTAEVDADYAMGFA